MKSFHDILAEKQELKTKQRDSREMVRSMSQTVNGSTSELTHSLVSSLRQISDHWDDLSAKQQQQVQELMKSIPTPETNVSVNLQGIERIEAKSVAIEGLEDVLKAFARGVAESNDQVIAQLRAVKEEIANLDIKVPDIQMPEVNIPKVVVPKPEVTVKVPKIEVPTPVVNVPKAEVTVTHEPAKRIMDETYYYKDGALDKIVETYDDGSVHEVSGLATNRVKHVYR